MANYCFTKYAIEGNKDVLEKIAGAINEGDGFLVTALERLGLDHEDYWEDINRAEWYKSARVEESEGNSVLFFTQAYPLMHEDVIDWVLHELGEEEPKIYYLAEQFETDIHETTDAEGKYFPERYYLSGDIPSSDGEDDTQLLDEYFTNEEDVINYVTEKLQHPIESIDEIERWNEVLGEDGCGIYVNKIDVVSAIDVTDGDNSLLDDEDDTVIDIDDDDDEVDIDDDDDDEVDIDDDDDDDVDDGEDVVIDDDQGVVIENDDNCEIDDHEVEFEDVLP